MPHKAFGVEWPIYQKKTVPGAPQTALGDEAHYWTPFGYAVALVDIVLLRSQEAAAAFNEAAKSWDLPGCQAILVEAKGNAPDTNEWAVKTVQARERGKPLPGLPGMWFDAYDRYKDNADFLVLNERVREFIRVGFNRQEDRDNDRCKVTMQGAPILYLCVIARTLLQYCKVKLEDWNKYRPDNIDRLMKEEPGPRAERLKKKTIIQIYKSLGCQLRHDSKLLQDADHWYQSRVVYSGPEAYSRDLYKKNGVFLQPGNVGKFIRPYDSVTNYPKRG